MRIIAGRNKSRILETLPGQSTRPMLDSKKEAVFNVLGPLFDGGVVLDLFGGSGALSLEALSRGCKFSYIVEAGSAAFGVIKSNVENLGESDKVKLMNLDYLEALSIFKIDNLRFDYVFLDPPYKMKVLDKIIRFLLDNNLLNHQANIVCQYLRDNFRADLYDDLRIIKQYKYKSSELTILEKKD